MRRSIVSLTALAFVAMALLSGCGEKHKAEGIVKDFLNENLTSQPAYISCDRLGTTSRIDDQAIQRLQESTAKNDPIFKKPVTYGAYKQLPELRYTRTTIVLGTDTFVRTVYLHPEFRDDGVMAVKEN